MNDKFLNIIFLILFPISICSQNIDYQLLVEINKEFLIQDKSFFQNHELINETLENRVFIEFKPHDYVPKKKEYGELNVMFSELVEVKKYGLEFCEHGVIWFYEPENYIKPIEIIEQGDELKYKFQICKFSVDKIIEPEEKTATFRRNKKKIKLIEIK